jgi:phosphoheptose isomerase
VVGDALAAVTKTLADTIALHDAVRRGELRPVAEAAGVISDALKRGHRVLLFGNGGSAGDAQHAAAELVGRFERERAPFGAIALTADTAVLTAVANDEGYERVFARQIEALGRSGDVAVAITTSGRSMNVVRALEAARASGMRTIALTGRDGGDAGRRAEIHVNVPSDSTPRVQEVHRTLLHAICEIVERSLTDA